MPLVKIEIGKREKPFLMALAKEVMDCVRDVLKLPPDDRNIRVISHDNDLFSMRPPYEMLIEIAMFSGRSKETKKALYRQLVDRLHDKLQIDKQSVFIVLIEQPKENWGIRGGVGADEVDLGFKVEI